MRWLSFGEVGESGQNPSRDSRLASKPSDVVNPVFERVGLDWLDRGRRGLLRRREQRVHYKCQTAQQYRIAHLRCSINEPDEAQRRITPAAAF